MAFSETLSNRIREALANVPGVTEKYRFGGICYMVNDKMCVGVAGDRMMCRIGEAEYEKALTRRGCEEMLFTGRPMKGYVFVSDKGMRTAAAFRYRIELCLTFNPLARISARKHSPTKLSRRNKK